MTQLLASHVEVPYGNGSWMPFQAKTKSVLPNHPKKSLHFPAQTAPSTHIMLFHLALSMALSYLLFSYLTWNQLGRALPQRNALSFMSKLAQGSLWMTSTARLSILRSLLSILNSNRMSAYLKISQFLWKIPLLSRENVIFSSWRVHQRQSPRSIKALPDEDVATIWSGPVCGIVTWVP